ncbi:porin family protein [Pedobacter gandavensis]|uniref:porin family protein n=1 Tax=Pedobacter gandavensis TaxID=2679963 RepID=UPI0029303C97|nr:porin family protein [Pedobacter gandavensis]
MKKLALSCLMLGASLSASAQNSPVKFSIKAGVTIPTISGIGEGSDEVKPNPSFYFGATVDYPLTEIFSLQSGLTFSGKGGKGDAKLITTGWPSDFNRKTRLWYLEIPVNAVLYLPAGNGKVFLAGGPYFGYAMSGKNKIGGTSSAPDYNNDGKLSTSIVSFTEDVKFGKDGSVKRSDFGLNFLAGYELNSGLNIQAGYGLGLTGIFEHVYTKNKNRVISVGIGFSF